MRASRFLAAIVLAACAGRVSHAQLVQNINYIGQHIFASGTQAAGTTLGGLSGIAYDPTTQSYFSISDDRSQVNPARFYNLRIDLSSGQLNQGGVTIDSSTTLLQPSGAAFPALQLDPEGIAIAPNGDLFVSSEGDTNNNIQPFINRFGRSSGQQNLALPIPSKFAVTGPSGTTGVRNNLAFETLTITPSGQSLFTATENALRQDGPASTISSGSTSRILRYSLNSNLAAQEYVYNVEPVQLPANPVGSFATNGLVDMLALNETTFLALERSFSTGATTTGNTGNTIKLYEVSIAGATDVSAFESLGLAGPYASASKTLLLDLATLNIPLDNIEGLTFGPTLPNGQRSLILVSDNNFSPTQFTQFVAFGVNVVPAPGSAVLLGMGTMLIARRRR